MTIPASKLPLQQHVFDTYASEIQKTASVWRRFSDGELGYRLQPPSASVVDIMQHELLSSRRFFGGFLGLNEPQPSAIVPAQKSIENFTARLIELAEPRLPQLAAKDQPWWTEEVPFFDVRRQRIWIVWRRILHSAHHRTQLTVYLRLLGKPVPAIYGPSADETWAGADPTTTAEAAGR